jgi:predicted aspartyl protease
MPLSTTTTLRRAATTLGLALLLASAFPAPATGPGVPDGLPPGSVEELLTSAKSGDLRDLRAILPQIPDPALQALARARIDASRLDAAGAARQLERYWRSDGRTAARDVLAWSIAADAAFAAGDYPQAAEATQAWSELLGAEAVPSDSAADVAQFHGIATLLSDLPGQQVVARSPRSVPTRRDKAGLLQVPVRVNGLEQDAILDTGANLSVVSRSTAERLGIDILGAEASVGSASRDQVATRIGVARELELAGVTLANVGFLVLADSALEMPLPGGYRINAIIGFPVLRAIGRMRFEGDTFAALDPAASPATTSNLHAIGNDLFAEATVGGRPVALHLDTGAPASFLSTRFARRYPELLQGLQRSERRSASAGGAITQQSAVWPEADIAIDAHAVKLPALPVLVTDAEAVQTRTSGTLGLDVLDHFDAWALDLDTMRLDVEQAE